MKVPNNLKFTADLLWKENMWMCVGAMILEEKENGSADFSYSYILFYLFK